MRVQTLWQSPDGIGNANALQTKYAGAFEAIAELDAFGHRLLNRAASASRASDIDKLVGLSMLRRAVTHFVGFRHLAEASALEQAKLSVRAQFETLLAFRYLTHGGRRNISLFTPTSNVRRETRSRYFYVAAERRKIYTNQALLDGRWGRQGVLPANRRAMRREVSGIRKRLESHFPAQTARYGPLLCLNPDTRKRKYWDSQEWYSFGFRATKVNTVRALAKRLGWIWEYEVLYGAFSGLMHPRGIDHDGRIVEGRFEIFSPYLADAFELLCNWSCHWHLHILAWAVKAYHPGSLSDAQAVHLKTKPLLAPLEPSLPPGF